MDPFTQFIDLLRPRALGWKKIEGRGGWALGFPATSGVQFGVVVAGSCRIEIASDPPRLLQRGDCLLLAEPGPYTLRGGKTVPAVSYDTIDGGSERVPILRMGDAASGEVTSLLAGHFEFDKPNAGLLAGLLTPVLLIRAVDESNQRLLKIMELIDLEAFSGRPGEGAFLSHLLELVLIESLRSGAARDESSLGGLLAGLADARLAAVLRAMHDDPQRRWTVASLAGRAGMSRSAFAAHFMRKVGVSPFDYLLNWRMSLARDALRSNRQSLSEIAYASGYRSLSAFSTAFTRIIGCPPGAYRSMITEALEARDNAASDGRSQNAERRFSARASTYSGRQQNAPPSRT